MNELPIPKDQMIFKLCKEYLRSLKLVGTMESLGFDTMNYRMNIFDIVSKMMGFPETTDKMCDIIESWEQKILLIKSFDFFDDLNKLTGEFIEELYDSENPG
jgi:hypothetical protein